MEDSYTSQGDNSQNISGKNVRIENMNLINAPSSGGEPPIKAERVSITKMPLSDVQIFVVGLAGVAFSLMVLVCHLAVTFPTWPPDVASVLSNWVVVSVEVASTIPEWVTFLVLMIFGVCAAAGYILKFAACSVGVPFLGIFEGSISGDLYRTQLRARCPKCHGRMKMRVGKTSADYTFVCRMNIYHIYPFDMTTLPDVAEDYARRRSGGTANPGGEDDTSAHDDDTAAREECAKEIENV